MATLYIHAGGFKTGSSSIQSTLARLAPERRPHLIKLGPSPNSTFEVRAAYLGDPRRLNLSPEQAREARRKVEAAFAECSDRDAILSAEGIENLNAREFARLIAAVQHSEIRITVYQREPYGHQSSLTQQNIKQAGNVRLARLRVRYKEAAQKFEPFGGEIVAFDRSKLKNGCVVQDFAARVGITLRPEEIKNTNERLSLWATGLLFARNRWRRRETLPHLVINPLVRELRSVGGPKFAIHPDVIDQRIAKNRAQLDWAVERFGPSFVVRPDPGKHDVQTDEDLLTFPEEVHDWIASRDKTYRKTDDPYVVGAAVDRIGAALLAAGKQNAAAA